MFLRETLTKSLLGFRTTFPLMHGILVGVQVGLKSSNLNQNCSHIRKGYLTTSTCLKRRLPVKKLKIKYKSEGEWEQTYISLQFFVPTLQWLLCQDLKGPQKSILNYYSQTRSSKQDHKIQLSIPYDISTSPSQMQIWFFTVLTQKIK